METRTAARSSHLNLGGRTFLAVADFGHLVSRPEHLSSEALLSVQVDIAHTMCTSFSAMNSTVIRSALVSRLMKSITTAMASREKVISQF